MANGKPGSLGSDFDPGREGIILCVGVSSYSAQALVQCWIKQCPPTAWRDSYAWSPAIHGLLHLC